MSKYTGIHLDISAEEYHRQFALSNSDLKIFADKGPAAYFKHKVEGIPEEDSASNFAEADDDAEPDEKRCFVLGRILHIAILEPMRFGRDLSHYVKPATYTNDKGEVKKFTLSANTCKAWKAEHNDKPLLTEKEERRIIGARDAVYQHPIAGQLLSGKGSNEVSVFATDPETGLELRMRADRLTEDANGRPWIVDLKHCRDVKKFGFTARDMRYHIQDAFYCRVLELEGVKNAAFAFIAVELVPKYGIHAVKVVILEDETREAAAETLRSDLAKFAHCKATGVWPLPYEDDIEVVKIKNWN